ncbi:unnamed protein product [Cylindrotheca closterium]|uniref:Glycoside hydrolase family 2 catalytic domain-containing protein n=1 Tax=Cylindrotheca closterium TaxID=2856 RepID=A0AAD2CWH6_9STRA|nr:unnamed protein product [Cylindrotheca closterium]
MKRDRNHPSVILWSFCNTNGCQGQQEVAGAVFQEVVDTYDGTRPTLANMMKYGGILSDTVDIQGVSYGPGENLDDCHANLPENPMIQSECCSCNTMQGEDAGCETTYNNPHYASDQGAFNGRCLEQTVNTSDSVAYAAVTLVWSFLTTTGNLLRLYGVNAGSGTASTVALMLNSYHPIELSTTMERMHNNYNYYIEKHVVNEVHLNGPNLPNATKYQYC